MSATTVDRNTSARAFEDTALGVAAATKLVAGAMGARNASGLAVHASDAAGLIVLGRISAEYDNSAGSAGDLEAVIVPGIYLWENDSGTAITAASIGAPCYVLDNQTVSGDPGDHGVIAGIVRGVTSAGVWVDSRFNGLLAAPVAGLTVTVENAATPDGDAYVTIQSSVKARQVLNVWFAATAYAAPSDLGTLTATTGTLLEEHTDDALAAVVTDANGLAVLNLDLASDGTVHAMVERNGLTATASAAITGN